MGLFLFHFSAPFFPPSLHRPLPLFFALSFSVDNMCFPPNAWRRGMKKKTSCLGFQNSCLSFPPFPFPSLVLVFIYHRSSPGTFCHWCGTSYAANIFCWRLNLFELEALCNKTMSGFWFLSPPSNFPNMQHLPWSFRKSIINIPLASFLTLGPRINKKKRKEKKQESPEKDWTFFISIPMPQMSGLYF